jgi:hypothetical protein
MSGTSAYSTIQILDLSGGENTNTARFGLNANQVRRAINMVISPPRALSKRQGYTKDISSVANIVSIDRLFRYYSPLTTTTLFTARTPARGKQICKKNGVGFIEITGASTFAGESDVQIYEFGEYALFYDGVSWEYSDSNLSTRAACGFKSGSGQITDLKPDFMFEADNRLFVHDARYPNSLFYSDFGGWDGSAGPSAWDFPSFNEVTIPAMYADKRGFVTAVVVPEEDNPYIFRENDIWKLNGIGSDYTFIRIKSPVGCIARHGVVIVNSGDVIFPSNNMFYKLRDRVATPVAQQLRDALKIKNLINTVACYLPDINMVLMCGDDFTYLFNADDDSQGWTEFDFTIKDIIHCKASEDENAVYFTKPGMPYVYKMFDGFTDDGVSFGWKAITGEFAIGGFYDPVMVRDAKFLVDSYSEAPIDVVIKADGMPVRNCSTLLKINGAKWEMSANKTRWNEFMWAAGRSVVTLNLNNFNKAPNIDMKGHTVSLELSKKEDKAFTLYGIAVAFDKTAGRTE